MGAFAGDLPEAEQKASLIAVAIIGAVTTVGTKVSTVFTTLGNSLN